MPRRLRSVCPYAKPVGVLAPDAHYAITDLGRWVLERFLEPPPESEDGDDGHR